MNTEGRPMHTPDVGPLPKLGKKTAVRPIFILATTPGAWEAETAEAPVVNWGDICHGQRGKDYFLIDHSAGRSPSRWTHVANKRPFRVTTRNLERISSSSTLAGAMKIAKRLQKEWA